MAEKILDGRGVITQTSSDSCVVSVTFHGGSSKLFIFYKIIFYTFGVQCEGEMTNILENGMEVELCYKISYPERKTRIVAVWLGEKPDNLNEDKAMLHPIYDVTGHFVGSVEGDNVLVEDADKHVVYINKHVVFVDGAPKAVEAFGVQKEIVFDAIPFESEHPSGAWYQATCAWIGLKPRLIDRFDLGSSDFDCGILGEDFVQGTVAVIPNDVVALVDVALESTSIKVLLFRSSFEQGCVRILDLVDVGDSVCMRLGSKFFFPGRRWWYAVNAFKTSDDISLESDVDVCREDAAKVSEKIDFEASPQREVSGKALVKSRRSEVLFNMPPLSGVISRLHDHGACIIFGDVKVFVHRDNFYVYKRHCTVEEFLFYVSPGNNIVYFEAILLPTSFELGKGECTYEATCAWMEDREKPPLHIRAPLCKANFALLKQEGQTFYGVVSEYLSPFIALAFIPEESVFVAVHVNFFLSPPQYTSENSSDKLFIINHVQLRDIVKFKLQKHASAELLWAHDVRFVPIPKETQYKQNVGLNPVITCKKRVSVKSRPFEKTEVTLVSNVVETHSVNSQSVPETLVRDLFSGKCPSQKGFLLNCLGILVVEAYQSDFIVKLKHEFGTSLLDPRLYVSCTGGTMLGSNEMLMFNSVKVRFDAEFPMAPSKNNKIHIVRLWKENGVRPDSETLLAPSLACAAGNIPDVLAGKITSIPFHDAAIATTDKDVPVLVTLESLVSLNVINLKTMTIDSYLSVGDTISAKVEKREFNKTSFFRAVKCFPGRSDSVNLNESRRLKWIDIWGNEQYYYQKALVEFEDGKYFVSFVSPDTPGLVLKLNLFEKGKVFVHCKSADPKKFEMHVGQIISFHVSLKRCVDRGSPGKGIYVPCAWIGDEPPPNVVLKEILAVPQDVIRCQWRYEAVVASFPLPFHAVCYIGHVPCLVRLFSDADETFDENANLAVGERLVLTAYEDTVDDCVVVLSNDLQNLKRASERQVKDVYRNITGRIVTLPKPVGKIKVAGADFEVAFELCHLRRLKEKPGLSNKKWLASVRTKLTIGKQVFCSVVKSKSKNAPHRAFEVFFVE